MKILVACESSGRVRDAFLALGHDAWSCDLLPTESKNKERHIVCDVLPWLRVHPLGSGPWDMVLAFPPCTHLASSGAKHFSDKRADGRQQSGVNFFLEFVRLTAPKVAIENPIGIMSTLYRKPDQIIQPWMFGHEATKATCLWLKGLPVLTPTCIVGHGARHVTKSGRSLPEWYNLPPSPERAKIRSRTFTGIAEAMASQWGKA